MNVKSTQVDCAYDRLLIKPIHDEKERGIIVPEKAKQNAAYFVARVVSAGHGRVTENNVVVPLRVKVGDVVMVERKAGLPLSLLDGTFLMISEMHVLAVVKDYEEPSRLITAVA
jgi:co-chaperonin GroES (HSP10)